MKLYSNIIGETGEPLLILHGLFGAGDNWKSLARRFHEEGGFQVHLIDQRNHGRSPHSNTWTYEAMTADLKVYCKDHELEKMTLLGHSMGGKVAMNFAIQYPALLKALIVVDIAPKSYPPHHEQILKGLSALYDTELTSRKEADKQLSEYVENWSVRQFLLKNLYWKEKGKLAFRMNFPVIKKNYDLVTRALPSSTTYTGPTLFIKGENSDYILHSDRDMLNTHFPKSQLLVIKDSDHWVHAEKPKEFFEGVIAFLKYHGITGN